MFTIRPSHAPAAEAGSTESSNTEAGNTEPGSADAPRLSPQRTLLLGLQQLLVSNVWLDPIFIASVGGLSLGLGANLVSATFIVAGLVTLAQTTRLIRLPVVEGPSSAFSPLAIGYAKAGSLPAASLGLLIAAALVFVTAATGLLGRVRRYLTPAVTGTIILLVGLSLTAFGFQELFGGAGSPAFGSASAVITGVLTVALVGVCVLVRQLRAGAFLIALVVGDAVAAAFGLVDFSALRDAAWVGFPHLLPYGSLHFDLGITITMCIVFFVAVVEAIGIYEATAAAIGVRLTSRRLSVGVMAESVGTALSAGLGGFGATAYAQNLGVISVTGVAKLNVIRCAAVGFLILGFSPKVAALLTATPSPVVGGVLVAAAIGVISHGARSAFSGDGVIPACAVAAALGIPAMTESLHWNSVVTQVASSQVAVGALVAVFLQLVLSIGSRRRAHDAHETTDIEAADIETQEVDAGARADHPPAR
ncbi:solute carrier family 23 protein [Gordonia sp. DT30]|uniref:solute carrier family 23 protein n=1 Tax=unclassified Gordonia (in: high G+C Gram-positive bacteria) TaxID=2657482 RepID=UPI003CED5AD7